MIKLIIVLCVFAIALVFAIIQIKKLSDKLKKTTKALDKARISMEQTASKSLKRVDEGVALAQSKIDSGAKTLKDKKNTTQKETVNKLKEAGFKKSDT
ncbi:MAG: hypothetical protein ACRC5M_04995 [Anaeroplasmataceae bacterium]